MGAFRTGSYEVTPPGRSRACGTARQADRSRQGQQVRVSLTESQTQSGAKYILTVLRDNIASAPRLTCGAPDRRSAHDTEAVSPAGDDVEPVLGRWTVRVVAWLRS